MLFTSWTSYDLWVKPGLHGFAHLHINSLISGIRELRGPSKVRRDGTCMVCHVSTMMYGSVYSRIGLL
jgi:hypothetical protein